MVKTKYYLPFFILAALVMASCLTLGKQDVQQPSAQFFGSNLQATRGESEIILNSLPNNGRLRVILNGALIQNMQPQDRVKIIVPDGQHTLAVDWETRDDSNRNLTVNGEALQINAASMQYVYNITLPNVTSGMMMMGVRVRLTPVSVNPLTGRAATRDSQTIDGAIIRASESLIPRLPQGAAVAVLHVSAGDAETSSSALDQLEFQISGSNRFRPVNRNQLDLIRNEFDHQMSGWVSDESQRSIAQGLGADFIITGNVTGSGTARALTLRALNVETGVYEMAREPF
ncbi:MAG: CsgG/HfaB family protein [Treponema sp.]|nr:CsgG/HfaB family protein [Treponema sp.]